MRKITLIIITVCGAVFLGNLFTFKAGFFTRPVYDPVSINANKESLEKLLGVPVVEKADCYQATISGVLVLFPKIGDFENLTRALQIVLNRATMGKYAAEIDLRFDKPIIKYGTGSGNFSN